MKNYESVLVNWQLGNHRWPDSDFAQDDSQSTRCQQEWVAQAGGSHAGCSQEEWAALWHDSVLWKQGSLGAEDLPSPSFKLREGS